MVTTASGNEGVLMVLDEDGKQLAWKWSDRIQPIETTALDFTRDLAAGRWIAARSKMSLQLQEELAQEIWNANGPSSARCQVGSARSRTL